MTVLANVSQSLSKDELSILAASDDRALMEQGGNDAFLPYDIAFIIDATLQSVKAKQGYDTRGVYLELLIDASNVPQSIKPGKTYPLAFFDQNPKLPKFVLGVMAQQRFAFAELLAPLGGLDPSAPGFKAFDVLLPLHREIEPLGIPLRLTNTFVRNTRTGKPIHNLTIELR